MFRMSDLTGRTALVTGVSRRSGIGFAIGMRLAELGANLAVHSWVEHDAAQPWGADPAGVEPLLDELRSAGAEVVHVEADLADAGSPAELVAAACERFGHLDIVVANHARSSSGGLATVTAEEIDISMAVNLRATVLLVKELAARHDGRPGGRAVMMTSGQHREPMGSELAYALSKGAIHQATASLADQVAERGITVNTVNPGPTDSGWPDDETRRAVIAQMPQRRWGQPADAARLIGWLCTDDAGWITGQVIDSEGGFRR
jgi:3-oxoacyl-[acyl-carrier protein] reductase